MDGGQQNFLGMERVKIGDLLRRVHDVDDGQIGIG
jgi:hypothetical protein